MRLAGRRLWVRPAGIRLMASTCCFGGGRSHCVFRHKSYHARETSVNSYLLIGLGGIVGANARFVVSTWAANRYGAGFPYGTFIINLTGSFLMGVVLTVAVMRLENSASVRFAFATGFLGGYTTFSTFAYETVVLVRQGDLRPALVNSLGSVLLGGLAATAGVLLVILLGQYWS